MERTILINWKWNGTPIEKWNNLENVKCREKIIEEKKNKIVFCWFEKNEQNDFIKVISSIESKEKLILLHRDNGILPSDLTELNNICIDFGDGEGAVYFIEGGFIHTGKNYTEIDSWIQELDKINNLEDKFEKVWKEYYKIQPFEEQKKKLINLWLPLAIDMQGLKDDNRKNLNEYFNEIKNDVIRYVNEDFLKSWEEMKNSFPEEVKTLGNNMLPLQIVESLANTETKADDFYETYVEKSQGNNFLPNWLKEVVGILDEKIKQNK